jgi:hypothetical protein
MQPLISLAVLVLLGRPLFVLTSIHTSTTFVTFVLPGDNW